MRCPGCRTRRAGGVRGDRGGRHGRARCPHARAFKSFDPTPLAGASLGQVHRAVLRDGRRVAVKVQRPGVREQVVEEMEVIEELAAFIDGHTELGRSYGFAGWSRSSAGRSWPSSTTGRRPPTCVCSATTWPTTSGSSSPSRSTTTPRRSVLTMELVDGRNVGSLGPLARHGVRRLRPRPRAVRRLPGPDPRRRFLPRRSPPGERAGDHRRAPGPHRPRHGRPGRAPDCRTNSSACCSP